MTDTSSLEDIFNEINNLLKDVCSFLTTEVQNGSLSTKAQNKAQQLVERSKKQVEVISTISSFQDNSSIGYPYLKMQKREIQSEQLSEYVDTDNTHHNDNYEEENYDQIDTFGGQMVSSPPVQPFEEHCPYKELTVDIVSKRATKFGPLFRKERYFFYGTKQQHFAGLLGHWLLIYQNNKKDTKVFLSLNLMSYRAQVVDKKKDATFEIISDNFKTYEFTARSNKDMEQWIITINHKKQNVINLRDLPGIPDESTNNNSAKPSSSADEFGSNSDIYESVDEIQQKRQEISKKLVEKTPTLPRRQPLYNNSSNKSMQPNVYNNIKKIVEEENTYDPVQIDYEDHFYDELSDDDLQKIVKISHENYDMSRNSNSDEDFAEYDELIAPETIEISPAKSAKTTPIVEVLPPRRPINTKQTLLVEEFKMLRRPVINVTEKHQSKMLNTPSSDEPQMPPIEKTPVKPVIKTSRNQTKILKPPSSDDEVYDELKLPPAEKTPVRTVLKTNRNQAQILKPPSSDDEKYDELQTPSAEKKTSPRRPVIKITKKPTKISKPPPSNDEEYDELQMPPNLESPVKPIDKKPLMSSKLMANKIKRSPSLSRRNETSPDIRLSDGKNSRIHGIIQQIEANKSSQHS